MRIAIVGGGLTGLTVAFRRVSAGDAVVLFEKTDHLGGQLSTSREDGFVVELGAEGFVARSVAVPRLANALGMTGDEAPGPRDRGVPWSALLDQRVTTSFRFEDGALRALAPGEAAEALRFQVSRADKGAGIRTFVGGMQSLADALARAVDTRVDLRTATVARIARDGGAREIDGERFDAVVVATPSATAAALLDAPELAGGETLSSVTVSVAYAREQVRHPLDGTGFVVGEPFEGFRACTFTSSKFAHRAPDGFVLLRAFFRPSSHELVAPPAWAERAARVLGRVFVIDGPPARTWVSTWPNALPVFDDARHATIARWDAELAAQGIHLAGSAFHGSGIDAAVRSAERVADRLG